MKPTLPRGPAGLLSCILLLPAFAGAAPLVSGGQTIGWIDQRGQEWLRLDLTDAAGDPLLAGYGYSGLSAGITFAGRRWRLATRDEILAMWNEFLPALPDTTATSSYTVFGSTAAGALALQDAFGITAVANFNRDFYTHAYSADTRTDVDGNLLSIYSPQLLLHYQGTLGGVDYYDESWSTGTPGYPSSALAGWMLAANTVDEGPVAPALSLALLGLAGLRRQRAGG